MLMLFLNRRKTQKKLLKSGFSLVELSIVLLIISLLVAGILAGKSVIRNAEIKSVLSEVNKIKGAVNQFKLLYSRLPGDMENASSYWPGEIDGDNDGRIASEPSDEAFSALTHLNKANLVEKIYTGIWNAGFSIGENIVALDAEAAALYLHCCSDTDYARNIVFNNHITIFSVDSDMNPRVRFGVLTPIEALGLDGKLDDGNPDAGFIWASGGYAENSYTSTGCYTGNAANAKYESANALYKNDYKCQIHFNYD